MIRRPEKAGDPRFVRKIYTYARRKIHCKSFWGENYV